jgi:hypothetical protein
MIAKDLLLALGSMQHKDTVVHSVPFCLQVNGYADPQMYPKDDARCFS